MGELANEAIERTERLLARLPLDEFMARNPCGTAMLWAGFDGDNLGGAGLEVAAAAAAAAAAADDADVGAAPGVARRTTGFGKLVVDLSAGEVAPRPALALRLFDFDWVRDGGIGSGGGGGDVAAGDISRS